MTYTLICVNLHDILWHKWYTCTTLFGSVGMMGIITQFSYTGNALLYSISFTYYLKRVLTNGKYVRLM